MSDCIDLANSESENNTRCQGGAGSDTTKEIAQGCPALAEDGALDNVLNSSLAAREAQSIQKSSKAAQDRIGRDTTPRRHTPGSFVDSTSTGARRRWQTHTAPPDSLDERSNANQTPKQIFSTRDPSVESEYVEDDVEVIEDDFDDDNLNFAAMQHMQAASQAVGDEKSYAAAVALLGAEDAHLDIMQIPLKYLFQLTSFRGDQKVCP
jgi:hypothetical protein